MMWCKQRMQLERIKNIARRDNIMTSFHFFICTRVMKSSLVLFNKRVGLGVNELSTKSLRFISKMCLFVYRSVISQRNDRSN